MQSRKEYIKNCIMGIKIATKILNDRDFVEVDANKGIRNSDNFEEIKKIRSFEK